MSHFVMEGLSNQSAIFRRGPWETYEDGQTAFVYSYKVELLLFC
jgi:hypothetical protein